MAARSPPEKYDPSRWLAQEPAVAPSVYGLALLLGSDFSESSSFFPLSPVLSVLTPGPFQPIAETPWSPTAPGCSTPVSRVYFSSLCLPPEASQSHVPVDLTMSFWSICKIPELSLRWPKLHGTQAYPSQPLSEPNHAHL